MNIFMMEPFVDYYAVLGIEETASPTEIKAAFKKLALQYHPDVYKADDAHERMSQILQAYRILSHQTERELYDAQRNRYLGRDSRSGKIVGGYQTSPRSPTQGGDSTSGSTQVAHVQHSGSQRSAARRDTNRRYAFPNVFVGSPLVIDLIETSYTLSPDEAQELVQHGLKRGLAPLTNDQMHACHRCHFRWKPVPGRGEPQTCLACQASDWAEALLLRCLHCQAIFESEQIRYTVGTHTYGKSRASKKSGLCPPYELFPLCPYCARSHWCPSEEQRVSELSKKNSRRPFWLTW
jgi:curved DNA-binding protein CbpA